MNKRNKILALALALALMLSLSGCGAFERKMAVAAKKMEKQESMRMDMDMGLKLNISYFGESMGVEMGMAGKADMTMDPYVMLMEMSMDMDSDMALVGGESQTASENIRYYVEQNGDSFELYTSTDGETWQHQSVSKDDLPMQTDVNYSMDYLLDLASSFEESGKEQIRGSMATVYSGTISGEQLQTAFDLFGLKMLDLQDMFDGTLGVQLPPLDAGSLGEIPTTVAIDDSSKLVVRYTMDMTEMAQSLLEYLLTETIGQAMAGYDLEGMSLADLGIEFAVEELKVSVELYDFNEVGEIPVPDGIDKAA